MSCINIYSFMHLFWQSFKKIMEMRKYFINMLINMQCFQNPGNFKWLQHLFKGKGAVNLTMKRPQSYPGNLKSSNMGKKCRWWLDNIDILYIVCLWCHLMVKMFSFNYCRARRRSSRRTKGKSTNIAARRNMETNTSKSMFLFLFLSVYL